MTITPEQLAIKLGRMGDALTEPGLRKALNTAGIAGKKAALSVASEVAGSDRSIAMGAAKRKVTLGAGYNVADDGSGLTVGLRPPGLWVLFEKGTRRHAIPKQRRRRKKQTALQRPLALANGDFAMSVQNQRRGGVGAITRAAGRVKDEASTAFGNAVVEGVRDAWR